MVKGYETASTLNPQQQQLFSQFSSLLGPLLGQSGGYLGDLLSGSSDALDRFQAPYMRQFNEQIVPGLAEQFAGVGGLSSSGFQQALGQAGAGLSENLAALREQMRSQVPSQIMGNVQNLLGQNTQALLPKQMPWWQQGLIGVGSGLGQGLGMSAGGGMGAGIGALGGLLKKLVGG